MKELMNSAVRGREKMRLVLISNYLATVSTNKNYANLIYANQLKKRIRRSIISVIRKQRTQ